MAHELGLVTSVVGAVRKAASEAGDPAIRAVALRVGAMSGALPDALLGSWPIATHGTPLAVAALGDRVSRRRCGARVVVAPRPSTSSSRWSVPRAGG